MSGSVAWNEERQVWVPTVPIISAPLPLGKASAAQLRRWATDPVAFVTEVLRNPETGSPFVLYGAQETFLRAALTVTPDGTLPHPELVYSAPKKSGKTAMGAMALLYVVVVLGGKYAEGYCLANDQDQAQGRVFTAARRMVEASPLLRDAAHVTASRIEFPSRGSFIEAVASHYESAAGGNPTISVFDELWAYTSERSHRLWDELVPPPTRRIATRLTVTYAGFEGESTLLEGLYKRALAGTQVAPDLYTADGLLAYWTHECPAPWQTKAWLAQMRGQLRPNQYLRMIENRWVTDERSFVDMDDWDACVSKEHSPTIEDQKLEVWVGSDASVKRDHTAIVTVAYDTERKKAVLVDHKTFKPTRKDPIDFAATVEPYIASLARRFTVKEVRYDPFQHHASAGVLKTAGVNMVEYPQTSARLEEMGTTLYDLVTGHNLVTYRSDELRLAISRAVAKETARGWRIAKEKASHKIDLVVALAMATQAAMEWARRDDEAERMLKLALQCSVAGLGPETIPW